MQLELIGCTSVGKSTLASQIAETARLQGIDLVPGDDFALQQIGICHLRSRLLRLFAVHGLAIWGLLTRSWRHASFVRFANRELLDLKVPWFQRWNQLRKVLKQLGRFEVIDNRRPGPVSILVDEGTLHTAHNLFVHVGCAVNKDHVRKFAQLVPMPDAVIYVREREEVLVERTLKRGHPRLVRATSQSVAEFVHHAVVTFDQLAQHPRVAQRLFVVQGNSIVSQPTHLSTAQIQNVLQILRSVNKTETQPTYSPEAECVPAV